jgi:hypothetical protein
VYTVTLNPAQKRALAEMYVKKLLWGAGEIVVDGQGNPRFVPPEVAPGCEPLNAAALKAIPRDLEWQRWGEDAQRDLLKEEGVYNADAWQEPPTTYAALADVVDPEALDGARLAAEAEMLRAINLVVRSLPNSFSVERGKVVGLA